MATQHSHTTNPFLHNIFPITVICDGLQSPANVGALFRICDAFGVQEIIFFNSIIDITSPRLRKTSRNTHKRVPYLVKEHITSELKRLRDNDYALIALEISSNSIPLEDLLVPNQKIGLIIGNEADGISHDVLENVSQTVHIEMYGNNSSMNVVQATGIALHTITNILK